MEKPNNNEIQHARRFLDASGIKICGGTDKTWEVSIVMAEYAIRFARLYHVFASKIEKEIERNKE